MKKYIIVLSVAWGILFILLVVRIIQERKSAVKTAAYILEQAQAPAFNNLPVADPATVDLSKEIVWLEQQLLLSKSDSMSLGINLRDSLVQVQLKGTILFQSPILKQKPVHFLPDIDYRAWMVYFGKPVSIVSEKANIVKKPVKKVLVHTLHNGEADTNPDTIPDKPLYWHFSLDNNIDVTINGVSIQDSSKNITINTNMLRTGIFNALESRNRLHYTPSLNIWLDDNDAKALYRALPPKTKVVFLL